MNPGDWSIRCARFLKRSSKSASMSLGDGDAIGDDEHAGWLAERLGGVERRRRVRLDRGRRALVLPVESPVEGCEGDLVRPGLRALEIRCALRRRVERCVGEQVCGPIRMLLRVPAREVARVPVEDRRQRDRPRRVIDAQVSLLGKEALRRTVELPVELRARVRLACQARAAERRAVEREMRFADRRSDGAGSISRDRRGSSRRRRA